MNVVSAFYSGFWILTSGFCFSFCLLVLAASVASAQEQSNGTVEASANESSAGKITGRVLGEDGRPLSDATVALYKSYSRMSGPPQMVTTDNEGKFQTSNLTPGLYILNAYAPGFVSATDPAAEVETRYYRPGDSVNLTLVKGGVITGTVRDANGEPIIGIAVRALRVRDANGRALPRIGGYMQPRMTDDRGVYRLYGLTPGTYQVKAGGSLGFGGMFSAYDSDAPTYFPSSTRDTAAEVPVRGGEEATGIDIRHRAERGHIVSGTITNTIDPNMRYGISVTFTQSANGAYESTTYIQPSVGKASFSFSGVGDGEYEVVAQQGLGTSDVAISAPRHVTVRGADVTGIELTLAPLASIAGHVFLEAAPKESCKDKRAATFLETIINARRDEKSPTQEVWRASFFYGGGAIPTDQGEFMIHNLQSGKYRLTLRLPSDAWYVRSIVLPAPVVRPTSTPSKSAETKSTATPASTITIKNGDAITGIAVNIAQDAASLRGRVVAAAEGAAIPANLKVYLVPTERERAEDVLRYSEATLDSDGAFALTNLAPGRYFIIARPAPENDPTERTPRPLFWDTDARAKLRREAEAAGAAIELQPCQRNNDYTLRYPNTK